MRTSQIAIVALGAAMIGACSDRAPNQAAEEENVANAENAAIDMNAIDMNASADMNADYVDVRRSDRLQASPSDSDVPVRDVKPRKGQRPHR
jgi:hypothetical protein